MQEKKNTPIKFNSTGSCSFTKTELPLTFTNGDVIIGLKDPQIYNQLLWSHYADSHKGICIVFNHDKLRDFWKNLIDIKSVIYQPYLTKLPKSPNILFKSEEWNYENEIRAILKPNIHNSQIISVINSGFLVKFPLDAIHTIYFGCRTSRIDIHKFYNILSKKLNLKENENCKFNFIKLAKSTTNYELIQEFTEEITAN